MKKIQFALLLFILFSFVSCSKQVYTADIDTSYYHISSRHKTDNDIDKMIAPYKEELDSKMDVVIAYNKEKMPKARPSSTLGNWFSDVLLEEANRIYQSDIDFATQNYGGIRIPSLKQGDITIGNIFELMPFDNQLVVLTLDGPTTQQLLDRIAQLGGWPISSSLSFTIDNEKATNIMINGVAFDPSKEYKVAIADYIANGGDKCFFLDNAKREDHDLLIRDLIINYLKSKPTNERTIIADPTPRISTYKM
ncbi:MAG: 5'-nucleotidase C-terminal domain-containing protein [Saprospiraceae bacterium]